MFLSAILFISVISGIDSVSLEPILSNAIDSLKILSSSLTDDNSIKPETETDLAGENANQGRQYNSNHRHGNQGHHNNINGVRISQIQDVMNQHGTQIAAAGGLGLLSLLGVGKLAAFCIAVLIGGVVLIGSLIAGGLALSSPDPQPQQPQFQPQVNQFQNRFTDAQQQYHNL